MTTRPGSQALLQSLEEALELLSEHDAALPEDTALAEPLPSLLEQCAALIAAPPARPRLRSLHHMACTGGTLISKCLSVMPNVTLLSEIDPLSHMALPKPGAVPPFRPTDLIFAGRVALRGIDDAVARRVFLAGLREMHEALEEQGRILCLRDHAHSHYCTEVDPDSRPSLHALLGEVADLHALVTVRHPLDSFLSLHRNGWVHFEPQTIDEYARRYLKFLDAHAGVPVRRYEDFVADPETVMEEICGLLDLPYTPGCEALLQVSALSGDSGRGGGAIAPRPRRKASDSFLAEARESAALGQLCERLGYETV